MSDRYKIFIIIWLLTEICENAVLSKIDITMTTINKKLWTKHFKFLQISVYRESLVKILKRSDKDKNIFKAIEKYQYGLWKNYIETP